MERMPYRRSCLKITEADGKVFLYRWYDEGGQSAKWHGSRLCQHCGKRIETWEFFYWRLYGLCDRCYLRAEHGWVDDCIIEQVDLTRPGGAGVKLEHPGGRDTRPESLATFQKRHDDWWRYDPRFRNMLEEQEKAKKRSLKGGQGRGKDKKEEREERFI